MVGPNAVLPLDAQHRINSVAIATPAASSGDGERGRFWARVTAHLDTLCSLLATLYPEHDTPALVERLLTTTATRAAARRPGLCDLDASREAEPLWFQSNTCIGYAAYAAQFGDTLAGVADHLDHLSELRVSHLHLMHVLRARPGDSDGGYAIVDYTEVEPSLGTVADLEALADRMHDRGIGLCLDVVLNHTAAEHPWAVAARAGSAEHRAFYLTFDDRAVADAFETTLPEVFPELAPGNFTFCAELDAWVWTTFREFQWDLDYRNPDVLDAMVGVVLDLANLGADVLRLDAIAFIWKRLGTDCQNQPEVHLLVQLLRALVDIAAPGVVLQAEAIVGPRQLVAYLGAHRNERAECQLAYHNQLMVDVWDAFATGDTRLGRAALRTLAHIPAATCWTTYVRCHDDIGWAVDDGIAAQLGVSGPAHRAFLAAYYRGDVPGSAARGAAFSTNPAVGDERTCGMTAALCGLTVAQDSGDLGAVELAVRRVLLAHAVILSFGGIPLLYMGDEIGLGNDRTYLTDPARHHDVRWMHRPSMDWTAVARAADPRTVEHRILSGLCHMIDVRTTTAALSAGAELWVHDLEQPAVLAVARRHPRYGRSYVLANFAGHDVTVPAASLGWAGLDDPLEVLSVGAVVGTESLELPAYGAAWFVDRADFGVAPSSTVDPFQTYRRPQT